MRVIDMTPVNLVATKNLHTILFSFRPNGSSAVDQTTIVGEGVYSVTRDSAGSFTVRLEADYKTTPIEFDPSVSTAGAAVDIQAQPGSYTAPTATERTLLVINLKTGTVNTDLASDANTVVRVRVTFVMV